MKKKIIYVVVAIFLLWIFIDEETIDEMKQANWTEKQRKYDILDKYIDKKIKEGFYIPTEFSLPSNYDKYDDLITISWGMISSYSRDFFWKKQYNLYDCEGRHYFKDNPYPPNKFSIDYAQFWFEENTFSEDEWVGEPNFIYYKHKWYISKYIQEYLVHRYKGESWAVKSLITLCVKPKINTWDNKYLRAYRNYEINR